MDVCWPTNLMKPVGRRFTCRSIRHPRVGCAFQQAVVLYRSGRHNQIAFTTGAPEHLLRKGVTGTSSAGFDIAPSGQSFVVVRDPELQGESLDLVVNWFEELKRLAPTN